jgi:hypothetical protein
LVPLVHYMVSNDVADVLTKTGHELVIHSVVTGGQALLDTLNGASQLVAQLDSAPFVIWLNPFWGPVSEDGKTFEQMKTYQDIKKGNRREVAIRRDRGFRQQRTLLNFKPSMPAHLLTASDCRF